MTKAYSNFLKLSSPISLLKPTPERVTAVLIVWLLFCWLPAPAQQVQKDIAASFKESEILFKEAGIISNVVKITNQSVAPVSFHLQLSVPKNWRSLLNTEKIYQLAPNDSLFVPVRIVPHLPSSNGGTKYIISLNLINTSGQTLTGTAFYTGKPLVTNWKLNVLPSQKIYFRQNENIVPFQLDVSNEGDDYKRLMLSYSAVGRSFQIADSSQQPLKNDFQELNINGYSDTSVLLHALINKPRKNFRRVDVYGYSPRHIEENKQFTLFAYATEYGNGGTKIKQAKKIDFIKLNNEMEVSPYHNQTLPLVMDLNIYNILGQQPVADLLLSGHTRVSERAFVNYQLQTDISNYFLTSNTGRNIYGSVGYYHTNGYVVVGNTGVGFQGMRNLSYGAYGSGLGISAGYNLTPYRRVGVFMARNENRYSFTGKPGYNYGIAFQDIITRNWNYGASYVHNEVGDAYQSEIFQGTTDFAINRNHHVFASGAFNFSTNKLINEKRFGSRYSGGYSGKFLRNKLTTRINFSTSDRDFTASGLGSLFLMTENTFKSGRVWNVQLQNSYTQNEYNYYDGANKSIVDNIVFQNQLNFTRNIRSDFNVSPFLFYTYSQYMHDRQVYRGIGFTGNQFNYEKNTRFSLLVKGGYNKIINAPQFDNYFTGRLFAMYQYRTLNVNLTYNYGPQSMFNTQEVLKQSVYPQQLMIAGSHQWQLSRQLLFENSVNYAFLNTMKKHSFSYYPTFYYYTYSGWRFRVNMGIDVSSYNAYQYTKGQGPIAGLEENGKRLSSVTFQLNLGVKKEFSIPVPKRLIKIKYWDVPFVAFLDLNGNRVRDNNEALLENVVIKLDENEVVTNSRGEAKFKNVLQGNYSVHAFSLIDLGAWFPITPDSIYLLGDGVNYIPFSRGVKVIGNAEVQREKFSETINDKIDVSKIKVYLSDSLGRTYNALTDRKGDFSFYVPYGNYVLTLDESMLGSGFHVAQNNINISLNDASDNFYYSFFIVEKKRKVIKKRFNEKGELIEEPKAGTTPAVPAMKAVSEQEVIDNAAQLDSGIHKFLVNTVAPKGFYVADSTGKILPQKQRVQPLQYTIEVINLLPGQMLEVRIQQAITETKAPAAKSNLLITQNSLISQLKNSAVQIYFYPNGSKSFVTGRYKTIQSARTALAGLEKEWPQLQMKIKTIKNGVLQHVATSLPR